MHAYYTYPEVNRFGFLNPGLHIWAFQYITISYIFFRYTYSTVYRLFETLVHSSFLVPIDLERMFSSHSLTLEIKSGVPIIYILQEPASPLIRLRDSRRKNCQSLLILHLRSPTYQPRQKAPPQFRWRVLELECYGPQEPEGHK